MVKAKMLLQKLWQLRIDWDESIPIDLFTIWKEFLENLSFLNLFKILRHVLLELCGYCDVSKQAYWAAIYIW